MRSHQAENSYHYVNRLLRSCFLAGSRGAVVKSDGRKTRVEFNAAAIETGRLAFLLEDLFTNHGTAGHELANASNLAFGLPGCKVELKIDDGQKAAVLVRKSNGDSELFHLETSGAPQTSFQLNRGTGEQFRSFGTNSQEYLSIVRRFRLAPFLLSINKERPPRSHAWGRRRPGGVSWREGIRLRDGIFSLGSYVCKHHHVAELRIYGSRPLDNGVGLGNDTSDSIVRVGGGTVGELDACRIGIGLRADTSLESTVSWVYCGETLQVFPARLSLPALEIVVDASDLQLDASQEKLVQDSAFKARWQEVKEEFELFSSALREVYRVYAPKELVKKVFFDKNMEWKYSYLGLRERRDRLKESNA